MWSSVERRPPSWARSSPPMAPIPAIPRAASPCLAHSSRPVSCPILSAETLRLLPLLERRRLLQPPRRQPGDAQRRAHLPGLSTVLNRFIKPPSRRSRLGHAPWPQKSLFRLDFRLMSEARGSSEPRGGLESGAKCFVSGGRSGRAGLGARGSGSSGACRECGGGRGRHQELGGAAWGDET